MINILKYTQDGTLKESYGYATWIEWPPLENWMPVEPSSNIRPPKLPESLSMKQMFSSFAVIAENPGNQKNKLAAMLTGARQRALAKVLFVHNGDM